MLPDTNLQPETIMPERIVSEEEAQPAAVPNLLDKLNAYQNLTNIATKLDQDTIEKIQTRVIADYKIDEKSRETWKERNVEAIKLATQIIEAKNFPWPEASNVKYPLITVASIQFAARAYPNIVKGTDVVKARVIGRDPVGEKAGRALRVSEHMSYQLTEEMEEWTEDMDNLLTALSVEGCEFKKTYFEPGFGQNVSELIRPTDLVVNYYTKNLRKAPRITHQIWLYPNEVVEKIRQRIFLDIDIGVATTRQTSEITDESPPDQDEDAPHLFLEQHRFWDLDGDGYQEPYICTVHKDTGKLVRVVARWDTENVQTDENGKIIKIEPVHYFTRFPFMLSPDGSVYGLGFGSLLQPINKTINTTINQLLDAGTRQNTGGGFIGRGVSLVHGRGSGTIRFKPGEYKPVNFTGDDIRKSIIDLNIPEPSRVLFLLLGTMIEAGKEISSVSEVMTGEQPTGAMPVGTINALIEQGLKVFSGIFTRIHRALKREFRKLHRLNRLYLDPAVYFTVMDTPKAVKRLDYEDQSLDIRPVSNPNEVSDIQKIMKATALMEVLGQGFNDNAIRRRYLEALGIPDIEEIMPDPDAKPPIDPKTMVEIQKLELERDKFELSVVEARARILKMHADAVNALARAEAAEQGPQLEKYKAELAALGKITGDMMKQKTRQEAPQGGMQVG